jgi:hypothetical protein
MPGRSRILFGLRCVLLAAGMIVGLVFVLKPAQPAPRSVPASTSNGTVIQPAAAPTGWHLVVAGPDLLVSSLSGWQSPSLKVRDQAKRALPARISALAGDARSGTLTVQNRAPPPG